MLQGMERIHAYMNSATATRAATSFPKLNIYEQANVLLKDITDSIRRFNSSIGNALEFIDAIPCHDGSFDQMVEASGLPELANDQFYVLNDTFDAFTSALMSNVSEGLSMTISQSADTALVVFFSLRNGALYINDTLIKTSTYIQDGVTYAIINGKVLIDDVPIYLDDMIHNLMQSDEMNRVNEYFLKAIAQGNSTLDVILNRVNIEFENAMDETKQYISYISSSLSNGVSGYMALLKTMFTVITTGVYSSNEGKITFTNNSQYVMKNFTSGILDAISNSFVTAWNATKSVFNALLSVINTAITKGYEVISNAFEAILSNYTTSKFNFEANNTNFAIGVIQYTMHKADWNDIPSSSQHPVDFDSLYEALKDCGPLKIKVLWGTMYVWIDSNYTDRIYVEHKLRTDITSFTCPYAVNVPATTMNLQQLITCNKSSNVFGTITLSQDTAAGDPTGGSQRLSVNQYRSYGTFYEMLYRLQNLISAKSDIIETGWIDDSEDARAIRIENAYLLLLSCVLWSEIHLGQSGYSYSVPANENLFQYIAINHDHDYIWNCVAYTMAWIVARRSQSNAISVTWPTSDGNAWRWLTASSGLAQSGTTKHIYNYSPMTMIQCASLLSTKHDNNSIKMSDFKDTARGIQRASNYPLSALTEMSMNVTQASFKMPACFLFYSLVDCLAFSLEYSTINLLGNSYICGYYGSPYVGDDTVFWAPPSYTKTDLVMGILLIAGIVLGVMLIISIPTMIIKRKLAIKSTMRTAQIEGLWSEATKNPTKENIQAYRKAVKRNNLQSRLFGGQIFSKNSYWGDPSTNLSDSLLNMSSMIFGTDNSIKDGDTDSIKYIAKLIKG